jgi:hypothetical protein
MIRPMTKTKPPTAGRLRKAASRRADGEEPDFGLELGRAFRSAVFNRGMSRDHVAAATGKSFHSVNELAEGRGDRLDCKTVRAILKAVGLELRFGASGVAVVPVVHPEVARQLERMARQGLYGTGVDGVAQRLIEDGVRKYMGQA